MLLGRLPGAPSELPNCPPTGIKLEEFGESMVTGERLARSATRTSPAGRLSLSLFGFGGTRSTGPVPIRTMTFSTRLRISVGTWAVSSFPILPSENAAIA